MKNIFRNLFAPALAVAVLPFMASCETDIDDNPTLRQPEVNSLVVAAPADIASTTYDLSTTDPIRFIATTPDYGANLVVQYQVQVSVDAAFQQVSGAEIPETVLYQTLNTSYTNDTIDIDPDEFNLAVARLYREATGGDAFGTSIPVYLRFVSHINGSDVGYVYSSVVTMPNVVTYYVELGVDLYYIVGAMQGWSNARPDGMTCIFYPQGSNIYSYTTKWEGDANLKFWLSEEFGTWDDDTYGCASDGDQSAQGSIVGGNKGAIKCPEPEAFYTITINMGDMTYQWTKCDSQNPAEYTSVGIVGELNGWDAGTACAEGSATAMKQVSPHNWYVAGVELPAGLVKFCANGGWDVNWGVGLNIDDQIYGIGLQGGANITVSAGTYNVFLNDITGEFVFVKAD